MTAGCEKKDLTKGTIEEYSYEETDEVTSYVKIVTGKDEVILLELYPEVAPLTVQNFQKLVQEKFYDGLTFHRVIEGFMIQTGDPLGNGTGGSDTTIKGEFSKNGVQNDLKHEKGVVSMARSSDMDSASSQFFICSDTNESVSSLDGSYAAFGKTIAGLDVVERISKVQTDSNDKPLKTEKMKSVRFVKIEKN
ncbi:peptidylprolyl isomerase [bacterium]|nr:peptidylprolyl isomerase [bacterium]